MKQAQLFQSISQVKNTLVLYKNIARWKPNKMELFKKHYWNLLYRILTDISPENYALRREKEKELNFCGLNTGFEETDAHQYDSYLNTTVFQIDDYHLRWTTTNRNDTRNCVIS